MVTCITWGSVNKLNGIPVESTLCGELVRLSVGKKCMLVLILRLLFEEEESGGVGGAGGWWGDTGVDGDGFGLDVAMGAVCNR